MYRKRFSIFCLAINKDKWILSSSERILDLAKYTFMVFLYVVY
jgi:hypothetical protein